MDDLKDIRQLLNDIRADLKEWNEQTENITTPPVESSKKLQEISTQHDHTKQTDETDKYQDLTYGLKSNEMEEHQNNKENSQQQQNEGDVTEKLNLITNYQKGEKDIKILYQLQGVGFEEVYGYEFDDDFDLSINKIKNDSDQILRDREIKKGFDIHSEQMQNKTFFITKKEKKKKKKRYKNKRDEIDELILISKEQETGKGTKMLYQSQFGGLEEGVDGYEHDDDFNLSTNNVENSSDLTLGNRENKRGFDISHEQLSNNMFLIEKKKKKKKKKGYRDKGGEINETLQDFCRLEEG